MFLSVNSLWFISLAMTNVGRFTWISCRVDIKDR